MKELYEGFPLGGKLYIPEELAELLNKDPVVDCNKELHYIITNYNVGNLNLLVLSTKSAFDNLYDRFIDDFDRKYPKDDPAEELRWWMARTDLVQPKEAAKGWIYLPLREKTLRMFGELKRNWVHIVPEEDRLMVFKPEAIGTFYTARAFARIPEKYFTPEKKSA